MRCVHNYPPLKYLPQPSRAVADSHLPRQSPQATVRCARGLVISRIDSTQHHGQVTPAQYQRGCRGSRAAVRSPSTDQMSASAPWKRKPLGTSVRPSQGLGLFEDSSSFPIFVLTGLPTEQLHAQHNLKGKYHLAVLNIIGIFFSET